MCELSVLEAFGGVSTAAFDGVSTGAFGGASTGAFGGASTGAFGGASTGASGGVNGDTGTFGNVSTGAFGAAVVSPLKLSLEVGPLQSPLERFAGAGPAPCFQASPAWGQVA